MWINKTGRVSDRIELIGNIENCMYLVKGKEIMIIGGGMSFLAPTLEKQFNRLDLDPERVRYQLVLHSHFDHCGAVSYCKKRFPNLEVLASAYAKETLSKEKVIRIIESMNHDVVTSMGLNHEYGNMKLKFKAIPVDRVVKEGDIIDLGEGTDVRIFEIPGHSKCSIAGYVESEKMLFPSDSFPIPVNGDYEQLLPMPNDNFPTYVESL
ncbi:MAG: MBL fold metallo-hydrolase, partial [Thermodesulfobacteriota bacterium]|nr:MBL fold metallo-hydrolase [Thermodesulfobacteriota bacterium]